MRWSVIIDEIFLLTLSTSRALQDVWFVCGFGASNYCFVCNLFENVETQETLFRIFAGVSIIVNLNKKQPSLDFYAIFQIVTLSACLFPYTISA